MSTRKLAIFVLTVAIVAVVGKEVDRQNRDKAFDDAMGALVDAIMEDANQIADEGQPPANFYSKIPTYREQLAKVPPAPKGWRERVASQMDAALKGIQEHARSKPGEANAPTAMGDVLGTFHEIHSALEDKGAGGGHHH